jgi:hypothetical protein
MVQTGAFLADVPIEPTIAVDSLSRMITSFIIHYQGAEKGHSIAPGKPAAREKTGGLRRTRSRRLDGGYEEVSVVG